MIPADAVTSGSATENEAGNESTARRDAVARAAAGELLGPADMAAIWRIGLSQFYRLNKTHAFDIFKTRPCIGPQRFSGVLVHRYLAGEPLYEPTFGRKRGAR